MSRVFWGFTFILIALTADAAKLYRFMVDGRVVMRDHIPAEYKDLGYEVLNSQGIVLEIVGPAPTAEELAQKRAKALAAERRRELISLQREKDQRLLRLYSEPSDVERARQRKIDEIDAFVSLQRRRILDLEAKLELVQGQAANYERGGIEVPADLRLEVAQLQSGIRDSHATIAQRKKDMIEVTKQYAAEYKRMRVLQAYPLGTLAEDVDPVILDKLLSAKKNEQALD